MAAILGICLFVGGSYFYSQVAGQWQQSQSWLAQVAVAGASSLQPQIDGIRTWYFGSIVAMIYGGLLTIAGIAQSTSASSKSPEKRTTRILKNIGVAAVIVVSFGWLNGVLRSSAIPAAGSAAASASVVHAASRLAHDSAPAPTREVIHGLAQLGSLEWKYLARYGTFTKNLGAFGFASADDEPYFVGSHYLYFVRRADQSQVIIEATGKLRTAASGIKLRLFLNADGTARAFRYH